MTDEVLRDRNHCEDNPNELPQQVTADPAQLFTGLAIGLPTNRVICVGCGAKLVEGQSVTVYGYRPAERAKWELRRYYCTDCAPESVRGPTLGVTELLAQAWLGTVALPRTRTHRLCLTEVEVAAVSPPKEGSQP